jgi:hypothetical protein
MARIRSNQPHFIYVVHEDGWFDGPSKIGTATVVKYRGDGLRSGNWRKLMIFATYQVNSRSDALVVERDVLSMFADQRITARDWVRVAPDDIARAVSTHPLVRKAT